MTTPNDDLDRLKSEGDLLARVEALETKANGLFRESIEAASVDEITTDLGEIRMGRFLATESDGDPTDNTFNGMFMTTDTETFGSSEYNFGGVRLGQLMFGGNASTGKFDFCGGLAYIDADGITGSQLLKWMIKQTATQGVHTRHGQLGMEEAGGKPAWTLSFNDAASESELLANGGAEVGDLTGWTDEDGGIVPRFDVSTINPNTGSYCFEKLSALSGVLYQDESILDSKSFIITGSIYSISNLTDGISVSWYTDADFISVEHIGGSGLRENGWTTIEKLITPPAGANVLRINLTGTTGAKFDDISLKEVTVNQKLQLRDDGLYLNGVEVGGAASYSTTLNTKGRNQNGGTTSSYTFMWQRFFLYRKIKLASVLCDCRNAATYTCTLRDFDDNVLATSAPVTIAAATADVVFDMGNYEMLPGRYRVRITRSSASTWWFNDTALFQATEYEVVGTATFDTTESSTGKAPFKLQFYNELP